MNCQSLLTGDALGQAAEISHVRRKLGPVRPALIRLRRRPGVGQAAAQLNRLDRRLGHRHLAKRQLKINALGNGIGSRLQCIDSRRCQADFRRRRRQADDAERADDAVRITKIQLDRQLLQRPLRHRHSACQQRSAALHFAGALRVAVKLQVKTRFAAKTNDIPPLGQAGQACLE